MDGPSAVPVVFEDPGHLLSALALLTPGHDSLREQVIETDAGQWGVEHLGPRSVIERLAEQHGWHVSFPAQPRGRRVPITKLLVGQWTYHDPLYAGEWAAEIAAPPPDGPWAWSDGTRPTMSFLLGASDDTAAQRILDHLTAHHAQGIRAIPILLNGTADSPSPFRFFWNTFLERPNRFLFDSADRVWYGPHGHGHVQIFLEYPWSVAVSSDVLHRLPWPSSTGVVLLGARAPYVVELGLAPGGQAFAEFPGVVRLEKGEARVHSPVVQKQAAPEAKFRVSLRLGAPDRRAAVGRRIRQLEKEIFAKQEMLKQMRQRSGLAARDDCAPEPLFLYAQQAADRGRVPPAIQRLLMEWSDQPEDLGSVSYAFIPSDRLPDGVFVAGTCLHVLAASTTLGRPGTYSVGARLLDYAPEKAGSWSLELDAEWAEHRLRLFVPTREHLSLYPNLRPSEIGADKLAEAILPDRGMRRDDYLFLLLPALDPRLHVLLLRRDDFRPLVEAFEWVLDMDAGVSIPAVAAAVRRHICVAVARTVDDAFFRAVSDEATRRVTGAVGSLATEAAHLGAEIEKRRRRLREIDDISRRCSTVIAAIEASIDEVFATSRDLAGHLEHVQRDIDVAQPALQAIKNTIDRWEKARAGLRQLPPALAEIRKRREP